MLEQVLGAAVAVIVALLAAAAYFWGSNWLLDKVLATERPGMAPAVSVRRDMRRTAIRPWLFLLPALLFLSFYLV